MGNFKDMENYQYLKNSFMKVSSKMDNLVGRESWKNRMGVLMLEIGDKIDLMVLELNYGKTNPHTKDSIKKELNKDKVYISGMMALIIKESGKIIKFTVMVNTYGKMVLNILEISYITKEQEKEK